MVSAVASWVTGPNPFFFGSVPQKTQPKQEIPGDWCYVAIEIQKKNKDGNLVDQVRYSVLESSTGDLYGMRLDNPPSRWFVSWKCSVIAFWAMPYAICMIASRVFCFFEDLVQLASRIYGDFGSDFKNKGVLPAFSNGIVTLMSGAFRSVADNVEHAVRAPFYAIALAFAALSGVIFPFEGMKKISEIEGAWHNGADYRSDIRYTDSLNSDSVCFLAYCMQKRMNLSKVIQDQNCTVLFESDSTIHQEEDGQPS